MYSNGNLDNKKAGGMTVASVLVSTFVVGPDFSPVGGDLIAGALRRLCGLHYGYVHFTVRAIYAPEKMAEMTKVPFKVCGVTFYAYRDAMRVFDRFETECRERFFNSSKEVGLILREILDELP